MSSYDLNKVKNLIELYKKESIEVTNIVDSNKILQFVDLIIDAYRRGTSVYFCGNGGSVGAIENFVTDLNIHPFVSKDKDIPIDSKRFSAFNLATSLSAITGIGNDLGFENIYVEQLKFVDQLSYLKGNILVCISGSGNSHNIVKVAEYARDHNIIVIGISRNIGCKLSKISNLFIHVPGISMFPGQTDGNNNNFHFEDFISKLAHITTGILKQYVEELIEGTNSVAKSV